jgi:excisionase family DNA binding protein
MSATPIRPLLTVAEVMATLRVSRAGVYRLFSAGDLRWIQVGAHRRVSAAEIDRFVAEHTQAIA